MPDRPPRTVASQLVALLPEADVNTLAETLVAFANSDGGTVYVGVDVGGVLSGEILPEDFETVTQEAELLCRPPVLVQWEQSEAGGTFMFVGQVHRSSALHTLEDGRILVRTGSENRMLSGDELARFVASRSSAEYEAEPVPGATFSDFDPDALEDFVKVWTERQGRPLGRPLDDLLIEMGYLRPGGQPTVAGILLFGKNPAFFVPRCGITFVQFEGTQIRRAVEGPSYGRREIIEGHLAHIISRTLDILQKENHLGAIVQGFKRRDQWRYPPLALREALVNAVAHRDYQLHGRAIEVRMFSDRLEISSPGGLPAHITLDNIIDEHYSRNPRVVSGLYQWGYIEELGMGVDLMFEEMLNAGHPAPKFHASEASFTVTFMNVHEREPVERAIDAPTMNERQAKAISYLQRNTRIRSRDYQELCPDVSPETLRLDLSDLVDRGILLKIGEKRGTYYILK